MASKATTEKGQGEFRLGKLPAPASVREELERIRQRKQRARSRKRDQTTQGTRRSS